MNSKIALWAAARAGGRRLISEEFALEHGEEQLGQSVVPASMTGSPDR
ncbi:hypothetical protein [Nonomuraea sp. NPDC049695]